MHNAPDSLSANSSVDRLPEVSTAAPLVVPVIEEHAVVTREVVESGRVRLVKEVQEHHEQVNLTLQHDEVRVERVPINQFVADDAPLPTSRHEGDTLVIPVLREVVVTRVLVVEEVRVTKQQVTVVHSEDVPLRHEAVRVERQPATDSAPPAAAPSFS